ncbi:MAG: septal ring lytic transglycosylase RlpA family protein, partial [Cytophagaceae bacterium]
MLIRLILTILFIMPLHPGISSDRSAYNSLPTYVGFPGDFTQKGKASYYARSFEGKKTASGAIYRPGKLTAAHKTLPFGTKVKVTNLKNKKSV